MQDDRHYAAIAQHYGNRTAARSGVPLMRHIDEGLYLLDLLGASLRARQAWCLHPLLQDDTSLQAALAADAPWWQHRPDPQALLLAMEYRAVANAYLSQHCRGDDDAIALSPLPEVNQLLVADKVQNRKDFEAHHLGHHPNSATLVRYFANWLRCLQVSEPRYQAMVERLRQAAPGQRPRAALAGRA
ncbi:hypothetical protein [Eleftheria terrae]|uniref:hypothetical protein n=1 Tax=Eleftheria terrae TaxID=1597781 RepID=UPI00263B6DC6|nr:hypothetical protein [Eleftheria terrae]WKB53612.1 hypothetical protein N7L95_04235 [Eleftheria terrae]